MSGCGLRGTKLKPALCNASHCSMLRTLGKPSALGRPRLSRATRNSATFSGVNIPARAALSSVCAAAFTLSCPRSRTSATQPSTILMASACSRSAVVLPSNNTSPGAGAIRRTRGAAVGAGLACVAVASAAPPTTATARPAAWATGTAAGKSASTAAIAWPVRWVWVSAGKHLNAYSSPFPRGFPRLKAKFFLAHRITAE